MKTYVDIECEEKELAIKRLEKLAYIQPKVCIYDISMRDNMPTGARDHPLEFSSWAAGWFQHYVGIADVDEEKCVEIISTSHNDLGEHDFMFEWKEEPSQEILDKLSKNIMAIMNRLNCKAKITNI